MGDEILKELRSLTTAAVVEKNQNFAQNSAATTPICWVFSGEFDYRFRKINQQEKYLFSLVSDN